MKFTHLAGLHTYVCPKFERADESEHRLTYFTKEEVDRLCFLAVDLYDRQDLADAIKFSATPAFARASYSSSAPTTSTWHVPRYGSAVSPRW